MTLQTALDNTLSIMNEAPDTVHIGVPNDDGWQKVLLGWNDSPKRLLFEIRVDKEKDSTLACILEREVLTYNWGETFMTILYKAIED